MARPKRLRKIESPPGFKGYLPLGIDGNQEPVTIDLEEYEAIRLSDFEMLDHVQASARMGISRPTYTRIYESARRKVATAFSLGKPIVFEGGKVYFDSEWYSCRDCGCLFNHPDIDIPEKCALCGSARIEKYVENNGKPFRPGEK